MPTTLVSIIIVNWNGARFLPRCLQSLRAQTLRDVHILVVDNGSTDESVALIRRDFPEVETIELCENLGYAEANNRAAALSQADYLFFLNNDTHVDSNALATLVSTAATCPHLSILAPQQRTYDGAQYLSTGMSVDLLGFPCVGNPTANKLFYADGACLFIRCDVFKILGGFDTRHFMFFEETDLCWRAWLWGYQIGVVPQAVVFHKAGGTAGTSIVEGSHYTTTILKRRLAHRNQLAMILKNYSTPALFFAIPLFVALALAEALLLVVTGQRAAVKDAYIPAWRDTLRNRFYIRYMRKRVQSSRVVSDWFILRRMEWKLATVSRFLHGDRPIVH